MGSTRAGASNKVVVYGSSHFLALSVNISKTVADIRPKLLLMTKYEVAYELSIDTKIDDLGWPWTAVAGKPVPVELTDSGIDRES